MIDNSHGGFRVSLQEATRLEGDFHHVAAANAHNNNDNNNDNNNNNNHYYVDWSVHTIDYEGFQHKLRHFYKRRCKVRRKLRTSGWTAQELDVLLGPPSAAVTRADVQAMMLPTNSFYFLQARQQQQQAQQQMNIIPTSLQMGQRRRMRQRSDTELKRPPDLSETTQIISNQRRRHSRRLPRRPPVTLLIPEDGEPQETPYVTMSEDDENDNEQEEVDDDDDRTTSAHSTIQYIDTSSVGNNNNININSSAIVLSTPPTHFIPRLFGTNRPLQRRSIMRQLSNWERNDLVSFLSCEMDKVAMFYLSQWQQLSHQYMALTTHGGYSNNVRINHVNNTTNTPSQEVEEEDEIEMNRTFDYPNNHNNHNHNEEQQYQPWIRLGKEILELQAFCAINIVTVRQILIRYDAFARANEGTPMMQYYMKTIQSDRGAASFRKILRHEEVLALAESFQQQLSSMMQQQPQQPQPSQAAVSPNISDNSNNAYATIAKQFAKEQAQLQAVIASSANAEATSSTGHAHPLQDTTLLDTLRYYFVLGMLEDRLGYEPSYLHTRGRSLKAEMKQLAQWRRQHSLQQWSITTSTTDGQALQQTAGTTTTFFWGGGTGAAAACCHVLPYGSGDDAARDDKQDKENDATTTPQEEEQEQAATAAVPTTISRQQRFNVTMALIAGFFYCMNYYIVEPSSTMYVNALGASDAMSATLIGMMPIASFLSAIAYSIWTNSSFRHPFLVSCLLMLTGNIIYSAAFNFRSLPMALAGRFMTGLGGPKCIIRRYLADTTSLNIRTSVNALFGMVVAAGSALGPGCAILLNKLDFSVPLGDKADIVVNGMTGPGWFMASLWTLFALLLWCGFREQDRIGLEEQMQKEGGGGGDNGDHEGGEYCAVDENGYAAPMNNPNVVNQNHHHHQNQNDTNNTTEDDLMTLISGKSSASFDNSYYTNNMDGEEEDSLWRECKRVSTLVTFPVRICLGLLFAKVFVIETLVSCTSSLSKNRYGWKIQQVGLLGLANGMCVIPLSILVGKASMMYQDRFLMICLLTVGVLGLSLLIDYYDMFNGENNGHPIHHSVGPGQYVAGYFITYMSIQSFEGIIGSALSKVIPTALATGTFNSGLLATLTDTLGRSCGDLFISLMGTINIDQLMNLLFVPGVLILFTCLFVVRKYYDLLAV
jgi:Sugar (and other) transporter